MNLTTEQQSVVNHNLGPALVFAVAGAGKTTSMVHRIKRLVEQNRAPANKILASSFSKKTVADITAQLKSLHIQGVSCRTLHSLGFQYIRWAIDDGHWVKSLVFDNIKLNADEILAQRAVERMAMEHKLNIREFGIDPTELSKLISIWKQNLAYADLTAADLPAEGLNHAQQAQHKDHRFIQLYQYYEEARKKEKWLTFDDMLMLGWEALIRFSRIRLRAVTAYQYVLVDEFQDVNLVQHLILDIITEQTRNYMAIGDDDQCIYEWRGANPRYILQFPADYGATKYHITENFRSRAQQTVLANRVISQNMIREPKTLNLTQGFGGRTKLNGFLDPEDQSLSIIAEIEALLNSGIPVTDIAILIRIYAQTGFLETYLIARKIPYLIEGNQPFYKRREVKILLQYLYWALLEQQREEKGDVWWLENPRQVHDYRTRFKTIIHVPFRYVGREVVDNIYLRALRKKTSILDSMMDLMMIETVSTNLSAGTKDKMSEFIETMTLLLGRLKRPAKETLGWLVTELDYTEYWRQQTPIDELAEQKIQNINALTALAEGYQNVEEFLDYIKQISFDSFDKEEVDDDEFLKIVTLHRSKGREWQVVFIPDCNEGTIPKVLLSIPNCNEDCNELLNSVPAAKWTGGTEEERRLFYVGITRAKQQLFLSYITGKPISSFLLNEIVTDTVGQCQTLETILGKKTGEIDEDDCFAVAENINQLEGVNTYFNSWWKPVRSFRAKFSSLLSGVEEGVKSQEKSLDDYRQLNEEYEKNKTEYWSATGMMVLIGPQPLRISAIDSPTLNFKKSDNQFLVSFAATNSPFYKIKEIDFDGSDIETVLAYNFGHLDLIGIDEDDNEIYLDFKVDCRPSLDKPLKPDVSLIERFTQPVKNCFGWLKEILS